MTNLEVSFASGESSLSVRSFSVEQRMSGLFEAAVVAVSPDDDLDLDALLGSGAVLRLGATDAGGTYRAWTGVVSHAEQVEIDAAAVSTYLVRIVPALWRTTRRRNNRVFQHKSLPEIAAQVLSEWAIEPVLELDLGAFPRFEYRVQYAETDFHFLSRILEEAGVAYAFRDPDPEAGPDAQTTLVLSTDAHRDEPREGGPLLYVPGREMRHPENSIWKVRFVEDVRTGRLTVRDYDFRARPDFQLIAEARSLVPLEDRFEHYEYAPGAFLVEPTGGGAARTDERFAQSLAARQLGQTRLGKRSIDYRTNVLDLTPGTVFGITGHPRHELGDAKRLLVTRQLIEGAREGEWTITGQAMPADEAYRPLLLTDRPRIPGVQSALVVGPAGEEIHTDEHGRVRVQFHWDREGKRDQNSSCFVRVSQAWAGRGYGLTAIPRVGDEVLVGFFEGDPDQPVIVGRVHNSAARDPLALPAQRTRSTWRSESTPGGGGWNEITFEDQKGKELVYVQAERDSERLVKQHEAVTIGASLSTSVGAEETRAVAASQTITVGGDRTATVKGSETISVGKSFQIDLGDGSAGIAITADKRIVLSTGQASIVLDGPHIFLDGQAGVQVSAGELLSLGGSEVHLDGGPNLFLNAGTAPAPGPVALKAEAATSRVAAVEEAPPGEALDEVLESPPEEPGKAPEALRVPGHVEEQLKAARDKIMHGVEEIEAKVMSQVDAAKAKLKNLGENIVPLVEKARAEINARIEQLRALAEKVKAEAAARVAALKAEIQKIEAEVKARIDAAKELYERAKHEVELVKERIDEVKNRARQLVADIKQRITDLRDNVKQRFDDLRKRAIEVRNEAQHVIDEVKGAINHAKEQAKQFVEDVKTGITHAKQHIKNICDALKDDNLSLKERLQKAFAEGKLLVADGKADYAKAATDGKALVDDAKANVAQIKADAKKTVDDAKATVEQAKQAYKDTVDEAKQAYKDTVDEGKALVADAKEQAQKTAGEVKQLAADVKAEAQKDVQAAKDIAAEVKQEATKQAKETVATAKELAGEAKQQAQGAAQDAKGLWNDAKGVAADPFKAPATPASAGAPVHFSNTLPGGSGGPAIAPPNPIAQSQGTILTRSGGLGADGVANAVNGSPGQATFLQTPNEGQLMVVPTQAARPVAGPALSAQVVEHQMGGMHSSDAFAAALQDHGYAVYERPWDAVGGQFLQKAVL